MGNISFKLNLTQLKNRIVVTKKGTECILIPVDENILYRGEKGVYLDCQAFELKKKDETRKDTHLIKQSFNKDYFNTLTEEEKKEIPILGNLTVWDNSYSEPEPKNSESVSQDDIDDLPF